MAALSQGAVVWAELPAPAGRRPVVILTREAALRFLNSVTVAPVTTAVRHIETEVILEPADGMPRVCAVALDNIQTIPRALLGGVIARLSQERIRQIFQAIRRTFDMP